MFGLCDIFIFEIPESIAFCKVASSGLKPSGQQHTKSIGIFIANCNQE